LFAYHLLQGLCNIVIELDLKSALNLILETSSSLCFHHILHQKVVETS